MKSVFSSRRNKSPHTNEEAEKETTPFFSKEHKTPFFKVASGVVQTKPASPAGKLTIGQPGDKYEKEADTMADAVVNNTSKPDIQNKEISSIQKESLATPQEDEKLGTAEQRMEEDKMVQEKPEIQRMEQPEEKEMVSKMEEPEETEEMVNKMDQPEEEKEGMINKMEGEEPQQEEEGAVQTKSATTSNQTANSKLSNKIKSKAGTGRKMSGNTRAEMESSFGTDFSDVHIHTDQDAVAMNKELGAQAFTHGKDVYFNAGKYNPDSSEGKKLLAHELTHTIQQSGKKKILKEAERDSSGNLTNNFIFRNNSFLRRTKRAVSDGPLTDEEIRVLRRYAITRNGTVKHAELLLMAAMRNTSNVAQMNAHSRGNFVLPMSAISVADRNHVVNIDRDQIPLDIHVLRLRRFMARMGLTTESADDINNELDIRLFEEIEAAGGRSFRSHALDITTHLMSGSSLDPFDVLNAMNNAASDSTHGDKVMAGITYIVAAEAGSPMASRLLNGSLKVDALIPRVYRRLGRPGDAAYQYSTTEDIGKSDTLYLPTNLSLAHITDCALIIHELTHAEDDFSTTTTTNLNSLDLEIRAYRAQSKYVMDQIRVEPSGSVPGLITSASRLAHSDTTHYWAYFAAAKRNPGAYRAVLNEILQAAPTSKTSGDISSDLGQSLTTIDTNLRNAILNIRDARGRNLYDATSTTRVDGASGHFFN